MRARLVVCRPRRISTAPSSQRPLPVLPASSGASTSGSAAAAHWIGVSFGGCRRLADRPDTAARSTPSPSGGLPREARADGGVDGGPFGVRRPLRFLAERLHLDDAQVREMARIIDELKTERAQAEVDQRRTLAAFADAVTGSAFDEARASEGADLRLRNAERLRAAVLTALRRIHALLTEPQREQLAYMIRTGILSL